ncbi:hypothetical protein [Clostridium tyrobutyricum]|nr:hypothetical protein [Clostridium tyrobutyricum]
MEDVKKELHINHLSKNIAHDVLKKLFKNKKINGKERIGTGRKKNRKTL